MTMFPVHRNKNSSSLGGCYGVAWRYLEGESYECLMNLGGASDLRMADESRLREISIINNNQELEAAGGSSSNKEDHDGEINKQGKEDGGGGEWLELRLGGGRDHVVVHNRPEEDHQISMGQTARLVELDLLPVVSGRSSSNNSGDETCSQQTMMMMMMRPHHHITNFTEAPLVHHHHRFLTTPPPTFFLQQQQQQQHPPHLAAIDHDSAMSFTPQQQYDNNLLPFRPYPALTLINHHHLSSSSTSLEPAGRPPLVHFHTSTTTATVGPSPPPRGMDQYLRVVDPPPRPHSGVWFILQPSLNQTKEPYLPQLPKSYLRIKDGRMTVRLLIKYLVNKFKLDSEFEVEITCKGQQLLPFLTLQHVRDNIWNSPRNEVVFPPHSSATIDHLMLLNYGRIA